MKETFKKVGTSKSGSRLYQISNMGRCKTIDLKTGRVLSITRGIKNPCTGYMTFAGQYVHRLVAQAFLKQPKNPEARFVAHANTIKEDNRACNLSYETQKENNNNELTQLKRSASHQAHSHQGEIIRAEKNGEVRLFKNGIEAAKALDCSHVLVYNCLNRRQSARKAKGWTLAWIPLSVKQ